MTKILASPIFLFCLSIGCATNPRYLHDHIAQEHKEASLKHSYGAALVVVGGLGVLGTVLTTGAVMAKSQGGMDQNLMPTDTAIVLAVTGGVSLALALLGERLIASGNDEFTPLEHRPSDDLRSLQSQIDKLREDQTRLARQLENASQVSQSATDGSN